MLFGIEQLGHRQLIDRGQWLWRGRFLFEAPRTLDSVTDACIERLTVPFLEAESDGWHVWVPTPGAAWARQWTVFWPAKPPKPYFPSWDDYRRAGRDDKLLWIYQFLVELRIPERDWHKHVNKVAKLRF